MADMPSTKERLAQALIGARAPFWMVDAARRGVYDDFESESATPISDLVGDASRIGLVGIVERAKGGEFDATKEEAEAWAARQTDPEILAVLEKLGRPS